MRAICQRIHATIVCALTYETHCTQRRNAFMRYASLIVRHDATHVVVNKQRHVRVAHDAQHVDRVRRDAQIVDALIASSRCARIVVRVVVRSFVRVSFVHHTHIVRRVRTMRNAKK